MSFPVILGIGNPGPTYARTRHNIGWMVLDELAQRGGAAAFSSGRGQTESAEIRIAGQKVLLVKPQTYVNLSGQAALAIMAFYKIKPEQVLVISDDIHLDLGTIRLRASGSDGGHNGLKDLIARIGKNFPRLRLGVGKLPAGHDQVGFVLGAFAEEQQADLGLAVRKAADCCERWVRDGTEAAMRFNGPLHPPPPKPKKPKKPKQSQQAEAGDPTKPDPAQEADQDKKAADPPAPAPDTPDESRPDAATPRPMHARPGD